MTSHLLRPMRPKLIFIRSVLVTLPFKKLCYIKYLSPVWTKLQLAFWNCQSQKSLLIKNLSPKAIFPGFVVKIEHTLSSPTKKKKNYRVQISHYELPRKCDTWALFAKPCCLNINILDILAILFLITFNVFLFSSTITTEFKWSVANIAFVN